MKRLITLMFMAFLVVGCAKDRGMSQYAPDAELNTPQEIYKIGNGDGLSISVWRNQELSVTVQVRPDGKISAPLVGDIQATGLTPEELAQNLTNHLENYIRNPQVTVVVTNAASSEYLHRVRVTGAVAAPASLAFQKGMTVMDAVLVAGGLTPFASANSAKLYRTTTDGKKVYDIKLKDILEKGDIRTNYPLQPGDIVTIPERLF